MKTARPTMLYTLASLLALAGCAAGPDAEPAERTLTLTALDLEPGQVLTVDLTAFDRVAFVYREEPIDWSLLELDFGSGGVPMPDWLAAANEQNELDLGNLPEGMFEVDGVTARAVAEAAAGLTWSTRYCTTCTTKISRYCPPCALSPCAGVTEPPECTFQEIQVCTVQWCGGQIGFDD